MGLINSPNSLYIFQCFNWRTSSHLSGPVDDFYFFSESDMLNLNSINYSIIIILFPMKNQLTGSYIWNLTGMKLIIHFQSMQIRKPSLQKQLVDCRKLSQCNKSPRYTWFKSDFLVDSIPVSTLPTYDEAPLW